MPRLHRSVAARKLAMWSVSESCRSKRPGELPPETAAGASLLLLGASPPRPPGGMGDTSASSGCDACTQVM